MPEWDDISALGKNLQESLDHYLGTPEYQVEYQTRLARTIAAMRDEKQMADNVTGMKKIAYRGAEKNLLIWANQR